MYLKLIEMNCDVVTIIKNCTTKKGHFYLKVCYCVNVICLNTQENNFKLNFSKGSVDA